MNSDCIVSPAELERETGLGKDLLRKWRSRYGFPVPLAAVSGEHGYPKEQIAQLRLIKRLLDAEFRPKQVVGKSISELEHLVLAMTGDAGMVPAKPEITKALALLKAYDLRGLDNLLIEERSGRSLTDFVEQIVSPLVIGLGEAWNRGEIEVYHEHLCTGIVTRRLFGEIAATVPKVGAPRVILATPNDELHVLGLLMAQAVFADQGAECINVGPYIPLSDLEMAIRGCRANIVALSFSFAYPRLHVRSTLQYLREKLPLSIAIWAGGAGTAFIKRPPPGVRVFCDLQSAAVALRNMSATPEVASEQERLIRVE